MGTEAAICDNSWTEEGVISREVGKKNENVRQDGNWKCYPGVRVPQES